MINVVDNRRIHERTTHAAALTLSYYSASNVAIRFEVDRTATYDVLNEGLAVMQAGNTVRVPAQQLTSDESDSARLRLTTGLEDPALCALLGTFGAGEDRELASNDSEDWLEANWGLDWSRWIRPA
jgi:hypothetical protein